MTPISSHKFKLVKKLTSNLCLLAKGAHLIAKYRLQNIKSVCKDSSMPGGLADQCREKDTGLKGKRVTDEE